MLRLVIAFSAVVLAVSVSVGPSPAVADQGSSQAVFGEALMTTAELAAHKERIANCRSAEERAEVESAHKERMVQRARWKGMVLDRDARTVTLADNN